MAIIENEDILKDPEHEKKLLSAIKRIEKASKEISSMGYIIYVSAHGSLNMMNIDDVPHESSFDFHDKQVVASGNMESTDCGDW
ncbi:hypothetical protein [Elizabethkingia miricola]|uniref:Uncharacterized protein n=1 Tax=Elizabethkingia miricola TaxID=172045 RepID=A0ABD5B361_ELIMR|nr:hypothetical protein [Elizabethkingia miricola]MDQ8748355.1 hypothetical protein [Elizabethkingia miricola]